MKVSSKGFTLVELMITMTILSALLLTGTYSYSILANRWDKQLGDFDAQLNKLTRLNGLKNTLDGISPRLIFSSEQSNERVPSLFFVGKKDSLLAISNTGFFSDVDDEVFKLAIEEQEDGTASLVYQSVDISRSPIYYETQEFTFSHKIVILEGIKNLSFRYLGWDGIESRTEGMAKKLLPTWRESFSGINQQLLPEQVILSFEHNNNPIEMLFYPHKQSLRVITPYINLDETV